MTRVWHVGPARFAADAFTGVGGLYVDGRWHHAGRHIIYTAQSLSLATLEILVHVRSADNIKDLVCQYAEVPDTVAAVRLEHADLPVGWYDSVPLEATKAMGDAWLDTSKSAIFWVPSAVSPGEFNALLNPRHRAFQRIVMSRPLAFALDPRIADVIRKALAKS